MKLPTLDIGSLKIKYPIVLGAMGVGVTRSGLAAAVTNAGGLGVMSGVNLGFDELDFMDNTLEANLRALRNEIRKAKEMTKGGAIGINFMVAMNMYAEHVREAVKEGIDFIVSGAGIPSELPALVKGSSTKIAPIISSSKGARLIAKLWDRNHNIAPDAVVLEGVKAGGHLGFSKDDIINENYDIFKTISEIKFILKPYEEKYQKKIPLIVAGGIYSGEDIANVLKAGGDGVQMATRFVATEECDAHERYKQAYIDAVKDDVKIIISPVGLPGRAVQNPFLKKVNAHNPPKIKKCVNCLKTCDIKTTPFCISQALVNAVSGNIDEGLIFSGENVYKVKEMSTVPEIFKDLLTELEKL
ncbi:NAD(P)H-dependent flavin oxidoreductase [Fusibacter ferrireducens]|uniref:Probable nitronate monooxygenase n=1 Tax=Fusibacter ferrireducens TaxID=2785058 RepID=A0ABS0A198_9FIRM|nr:nitronate monooxygenase [Fusibacter ferrireducens]MBF4695895.1 nitronate monooxygenase [Fusibacter ferrireducens]